MEFNGPVDDSPEQPQVPSPSIAPCHSIDEKIITLLREINLDDRGKGEGKTSEGWEESSRGREREKEKKEKGKGRAYPRVAVPVVRHRV